ncbi:GTPase [Specibacter sp. NPDC057265]|uniref:GTPase n=1 Tax=Specibacter sp. NPDC057265 TaxID=3346075 RepID=UPI003630048F
MSRHRQVRTESTLSRRLEALNEARELAQGRLEDPVVAGVLATLERAASRRTLSAEHTVVGFFGATGSGKSSLFNAVAATDAARVAVRRPTTNAPLAMVWGQEGSAALLDWLEVADRRAGGPVPGLAAQDGGLILLDLPDFDSVQAENRRLVERLAGQVDVLVWVVDPQKYADAAIHHDFIAPHSAHGAVTLVVLNQVDRLKAEEVKPVLDSLAAILDSDGLASVPVAAVSAATGAGVPELRRRLAAVVKARAAQSARLAADVQLAATRLHEASGEGSAAGVDGRHRKQLVAGLTQASHVEDVVAAVRLSHRLEASKRTGWPPTRWLSHLRQDPLRRLSLRREGAREVNRTSLPPAGPAESAQLDAAIRDFAEAGSSGAPGPWRAAIRAAARSHRAQLPDALDEAIAGTDLKANIRPWWWQLFAVLQWLALAVAAGGLLWLAGLAMLGFFQMPVPPTPRVQNWPLPTLMAVGGAVAGVFLAVSSKFLALLGSANRANRARRLLRSGVAGTAQSLIVDPVEAEIERCRAFQKALAAAR